MSEVTTSPSSSRRVQYCSCGVSDPMRATTSTPPVQVPSSSSGRAKPSDSSRSPRSSKDTESGRAMISAAPSRDCVKTSQSRLAGETPSFSSRVTAEVPRAEAELRSRSYADAISASTPEGVRLPDLVPHRRPVGPPDALGAGGGEPHGGRELGGPVRPSPGDEPADHEGQDQRCADHEPGTQRTALPSPARWCETNAMPEPEAAADVIAAGAVVLRRAREVLLVHRPRYDDWSFAKGKLDPGEHEVAAAVREVAEETGLHIRLAAPLSPQRYPLANGRPKLVALLGRSRRRRRRRQRLPRQRRDRRGRLGAGEGGARAPHLRLRPADPGGGAPRREEDPGGRRAPARRRAAAQALGRRRPAAAPAPVRHGPGPGAGAAARGVRRHHAGLLQQPALRGHPGGVRRDDRLPAAAQRRPQRGGCDEVLGGRDRGGPARRRRQRRAVHAPAGAAAGLGGARPGESGSSPGEMLVAHHRKGVLVALERHARTRAESTAACRGLFT